MDRVAVVLVLALLGAGCAGADASTGWTFTADTLPSGAVSVTNTPSATAAATDWTLEENLRIGSVDGGGPDTFGELKALLVESDGRIVVLESQAQQVRVFDEAGAHLATWGGRGEGPGELSNALGIMRASNGLLYVPDQRNARMTIMSVDSGVIRTVPFRLYRWGYVWNGVMRGDDHILVPSFSLDTRRDLTRIYSPDLVEVDSILEPERPPIDQNDPPGAFAWQSADGRMRGFQQVPFFSTGARILDRTGHSWAATAGDPAYRITRTTLTGDTVLMLTTQRDPLPVSSAERDSAMAVIEERLSRYGVGRLDASKVPALKPSVLGMFIDEQDRLWVQTSPPDSLRRYDVYERDGRYTGSLATDLNILPWVAPVVRGDTMWAVVTDDLDVPHIVRAVIRKE